MLWLSNGQLTNDLQRSFGIVKVLDLFSGIGGFSLGLERAGMETVAFCEIEKYPQTILKKHWPEVPLFEDIRKLNKEVLSNAGIKSVDLVCGGFPCQPFSSAGHQKGHSDDRHLWPEMLRIIKETRPSWVVGENVAGFVRMALEEVCADLESEGYEVQPFIIPACAVQTDHRRNRCWILAYSKSGRCRGGGCEKHTAEQWELQQSEREGSSLRSEIERCGLVSISKEYKPAVCRTVDGVSSRLDKDRMKALGNSVHPKIPEIIGRAIMQIETNQ